MLVRQSLVMPSIERGLPFTSIVLLRGTDRAIRPSAKQPFLALRMRWATKSGAALVLLKNLIESFGTLLR